MPATPTLWKMTLPSGSVYELEDRTARQMATGGIRLLGETTDNIVDGASTPTSITIVGETGTHEMAANEAVFKGSKEFVWTGSKWIEWGDLTGLGALATKNSATGSFTPQGSISIGNSGTAYTPEGTIQVNAASGSGTSYTPEGAIAVNAASGSGTAYTPEGTVSQPSFTGEEMSSSGSFTPAGSIQVNASNGTGTDYTPEGSIAVNASTGSGTEYTPEGSVSAPAISVKTAGTTQSITPFGSAGTKPTLGMTVTDGNLVITFDQGTLPSGGTAVTVKTGDAAYEAAAPTFSGTKKKFAFSGTKKKLAFAGTSGNVSVSGTPSGSVSQPTFTGTQKKFAFTGTEKKLAFSGTQKKFAFTGTQGTVTVS